MLPKFVPAVVMKSKLPSSSLRPWNVVVWAIRFKASSDESICNWLAAICSALKSTVVGRLRSPGHECRSSSELTWPRALSAVAMTWFARSVLLMARLMLVMSLRRFSLAIKPAGSSLPVLIRKPVLKPRESLLQSGVGPAQRVLGDQRTDVRINPCHCKTPLWDRNLFQPRPECAAMRGCQLLLFV